MHFSRNILILHNFKINAVRFITQKKKLHALLEKRHEAESSLGFVPTMGALHRGHFSLIDQAVSACDIVVVSIFVNPTQFNDPADLESYPKSMETDMKALKQRYRELIIFAPDSQEIYGENPTSEHFDFGPLTETMEGKSRAGHFDGVGTVLKKLFAIVKPDKAFFGEKDYQQFLIVKKLGQLTGQNIEIIGCPIERQDNGLAMSSRNKNLTPAQRKEAALLYKSLKKTKRAFASQSIQNLKTTVEADFHKSPNLNLEYFEIAGADTLTLAQTKQSGKRYRGFIAAEIGGVRLIDNMALN